MRGDEYGSAFDHLIDRLKTIRGEAAGFNHDVGGRVYEAFFTPGQGGKIEMPYLCATLFGKWPAPECEGTFINATMRIDVTGFLPASEKLGQFGASRQMLKLKRDLDVVIMPPTRRPEWNLGDRIGIQDVSLGETAFATGMLDGVPWDEMTIQYFIKVRIVRADASAA